MHLLYYDLGLVSFQSNRFIMMKIVLTTPKKKRQNCDW